MKDHIGKNLKAYHELQPYRIQEILLVSSLYDAFIFEEDGLLTEQLFEEYIDLNLHFAPRITQVSSTKEALDILKLRSFDLVISTMQVTGEDLYSFFSKIKKEYPRMSTAVLTYSDSKLNNISKQMLDLIDGVFAWNGDTSVFLVIIKLIEDKLNVEFDTINGNVRTILVVEDSIKNYSSFLPSLYFEIMNQTKSLISETYNSGNKIFKMRARPKVLLATNYTEAVTIFEKYKKYFIGVISDISFPDADGIINESGFTLLNHVKAKVHDLPILLFSSESWYRARAYQVGAAFIDKNSETLLQELRNFIKENLGFGDFIFRLKTGEIVARAKDLTELEHKLKTVPDESIVYHGRKNHFSNWLMARGEYVLAGELRPRKVDEFTDVSNLRSILLASLQKHRYHNQLGQIVDFSNERDFKDINFIKLGRGSIGGKARGLAFLNALINQNKFKELFSKYSDVEIKIPKTVVIGTDDFFEFIEDNNLRSFVIKDLKDEEIAKKFLDATLSSDLVNNLFLFLKNIKYPLAVRSSSLLEDSHSQPFAGIYSTYMLANLDADINVRLEQLINAIKLIYASTFFRTAKTYIEATLNRIEEEKMAIVIQEIVGKNFSDLYYPNIAGLTRSVNYFPFSHASSTDGIAYLALGLGRTIMEGMNSLHFCPKYPNILPQFNTISSALSSTQKQFYALNLNTSTSKLDLDESITLNLVDLKRAEIDGTLDSIASVYDYENDLIKDGLTIEKAKRIVSFANILKNEKYPIANIIVDILEMGKYGLGCDVEIEFAVNLPDKNTDKLTFNLLQIRPLVSGKEHSVFDLETCKKEAVLCYSNNILGNGRIEKVKDIVYIKKNAFNKANTRQIAEEFDLINKKIAGKAIYVGFGRWGTSDRWLGIPVTWQNISKAAVLIETSLDEFEIEPSFGSHFFHNLISLGIVYFYINHKDTSAILNWDFLEKQKAVFETKYLKHISFDNYLNIIADGKSSKGIVMH